jgi:hypothetical protein
VPVARGDHHPLGDADAWPDAGQLPAGELFEGGTEPPWWQARWTALSRGGRRLVAGLAVLVLLLGAVLVVRDWSAERELRRAVDLTATFGVWSSSTSVPGGEVGFFLLVRNEGPLPVSVTSVSASDPGLQVRMRDDGDRWMDPGQEIDIPLSARLTCVPGAGAARPALDAAVGVRRDDGGSTTRRVELRPAALVLDVVATLCAVRPELRDHELGGPVLRAPTDR